MYGVDELRPDIVAFEKWLIGVGRSPVTGWRWRKNGWITTVNIAGRHYIQREEIDRFNARAARGDFSKATKVPGKALAV